MLALGEVDDIAIVKTIATDVFNHAPAKLFMNTGFQAPSRPCLGSWATYGLGTENQDLPGFVVLISSFAMTFALVLSGNKIKPYDDFAENYWQQVDEEIDTIPTKEKQAIEEKEK